MGAVTALLHGERDPSIASMVLDSAFSSLVVLAEEMVELGRKQGLFAPGFLVRMALQFVRSSVQKSAGFDIKALVPIDSADKCYIPTLFVAAEDDTFVNKSHRYERYFYATTLNSYFQICCMRGAAFTIVHVLFLSVL
jgi:acetyl esterase/lipase